MLDADNIFQFKLTLTDSFPEVWRRILVPDECTLGDLHYVISYSFCWFQDSEHEFSQGSRLFGPKDNRAPGKLEDEHQVFLLNLFKRPGHDMRYVYRLCDEWRVEVVFEGEQAPVPRGHYPCCIAGANNGPPDGVGGVGRYNEVVEAFHNAEAWKALCAKLGPCDWQLGFEPTYLAIGDINGALSLIFPASEAAQAPV
jgi:hypothetical protein